MKTNKLGNTDLEITNIGLGTWAIGGPWTFGWGPQNDRDSIETIKKSYDLGINWIDTAPAYGLGHSEKVVGKALKEIFSFFGSAPYVFTKLGIQWDENRKVAVELRPNTIHQEIDESLKRLDVDVIDLMQIHWPVPDDQIEASWEKMLEARDAGKIRYLGVCNFDDEQIRKISKLEAPVANQPPFNLLQQQIAEKTLPYCEDHSIGVIPYSPMLSGLLSGAFDRDRVAKLADDDWRKHLPILKGEELGRFLALTDRLKELALSRETTLAHLAIAWVLHSSAVTGAIVGARHPDQIVDTLGATEITIDSDLEKQINMALDEYGTRTLKLYG